MIYLLIPFLFLSALASETTKPALDILAKLNVAGYPEQNQCTDESELFNKCAQDLCGAPSTVPAAYLNNRNFDQYVQVDKLKDFDRLEGDLKFIFNHELKENQQKFNKLREALAKNDGKLKLEDLDSVDLGELARFFTADFYEILVDTTKPINNRIRFDLFIPNSAPTGLKEFTQVIAEEELKRRTDSFSSSIVMDAYSLDEAKGLFKKRWAKLQREINSNEPDKSTKDQFKTLTDEFLNKELKTTEDILDLVYRLEEIEGIVNPNQLNLNSSCQSDKCRTLFKSYLENFNFPKLLDQYEQKLKDSEKLIRAQLVTCKSQFAMDTIESYENEEFRKHIPAVKAAILKNVAEGYSEHSRAALENYLNNGIEYVSEKEKTDTLKSSIEKYIEQIKSSTVDPSFNIGLELQNLIDPYSMEANTPLRDSGVCDRDAGHITWDSFIPMKMMTVDTGDSDLAKDKIQMSLFTCTHHQIGKSVLAHEIGHAVSWAFLDKKLSEHSYKEFMKMRACVNQHYKIFKHPDSPVTMEHEHDTYRTEEDMADVLGTKALSDDKTLLACSLLTQSHDGSAFEYLSLSNPIQEDTHSSPFLRLLQEAIHKRIPLSSACQEVINNHKHEYRFEPCF